jgi:hypothetical protein
MKYLLIYPIICSKNQQYAKPDRLTTYNIRIYLHNTCPAEAIIAANALDENVAKNLWEFAEQTTGFIILPHITCKKYK